MGTPNYARRRTIGMLALAALIVSATVAVVMIAMRLEPSLDCTVSNTVQIRPGDTMSSIAKDSDVYTSQLRVVNPNVDPGKLEPGGYISIPSCK